MPAAPPASPVLGARIRSLRRREGVSQAQLAADLGISPSYLNLIEANRRPLTASLLIRLAQRFQLDLQAFAPEEESRLASDLMEALGDPVFEPLDLTTTDVRDLAQAHPQMARALFALYRAYQSAKGSLESLSEQVADGQDHAALGNSRLPSEEAADFVQDRMNHFPELEAAAEALWAEGVLEPEHLQAGLVRVLAAQGITVKVERAKVMGGTLRRYDPAARRLALSELLPEGSRTFQLAHQIALLRHGDLLDALTEGGELSTPASRALARIALANYFAAAVRMPYRPFLEAAKAERYDLELLGRRFQASFEQVCHRLTTLRRRGAEGVPFHFLRIDIAGNISKRFSASGIRFARFSGACPRWNVHAAFMTPGLVRTQLSQMPDGTRFFCIARTVPRETGHYRGQHAMQAVGLGCEIGHAKELIYSDGIRLDDPRALVPIGVSCRLCERTDCEQRAFPPLHHPLQVDEHQRRTSFYAHLD